MSLPSMITAKQYAKLPVFPLSRIDEANPMKSPTINVASTRLRVIDYAKAFQIGVKTDNLAYRLMFERIDALGGLPDELHKTAAKYSAGLAATMQDRVSRMSRDMEYGGLDTSKLVRLAKPTSAAQFERDASHAFRRRTAQTKQVPLRVTIVADFAWTIRQRDPAYTKRLSTLVSILAEACEIAKVPCTAYGVRGRLVTTKDNQIVRLVLDDKPFAYVVPLKEAGRRCSPAVFHICNREKFFSSVYGFIQKHQASTPRPYGSVDGTGGIDYAREHDKANFVIAIGNFGDKAKPDLHFPASVSIDDMVAQIRNHLKSGKIS